jgi:hypothetical protein
MRSRDLPYGLFKVYMTIAGTNSELVQDGPTPGLDQAEWLRAQEI